MKITQSQENMIKQPIQTIRQIQVSKGDLAWMQQQVPHWQ